MCWFRRDPISGNSGLEHFLEVIGIITVKKLPANQEPGMVINDHDTVDTPAYPVFCNVWSRKLITQIENPGKNMEIFRKVANQQRLRIRNVRLLS